MKANVPYAEINVAKVPADGNFGGMIFALATVMIFFWGIPLVRYLFPCAILLGCGVALVLHFIHRADPWPKMKFHVPKDLFRPTA
jgi:hypothetical protein